MLVNVHKLIINIYETFVVIHGHLCSWTNQAADSSNAVVNILKI